MALSTNVLRLMKSLYWIVLSCAHLYICYTLLVTNRAIAGFLWLIAGFLLIYALYPVYFPAGDPGSKWPPYVRGCPDYLTMIAPNACADYVGLNNGKLQKSDPAHPPIVTDATRVFDASGDVGAKAARAQQYGLSWEGVA